MFRQISSLRMRGRLDDDSHANIISIMIHAGVVLRFFFLASVHAFCLVYTVCSLQVAYFVVLRPIAFTNSLSHGIMRLGVWSTRSSSWALLMTKPWQTSCWPGLPKVEAEFILEWIGSGRKKTSILNQSQGFCNEAAPVLRPYIHAKESARMRFLNDGSNCFKHG